MTNVKPWDLVHLRDEQWRTPSLCGDWAVQQTLGHITAAASTNPPKWMARFAGTGFRFDTLIAKDIATQTAGGPAQTRALDELDGEGVDILRARMSVTVVRNAPAAPLRTRGRARVVRTGTR